MMTEVPRYPVLLTDVDVTLDETHYCVICSAPMNRVTLPLTTGNAGRVYVVKNVDIELPSLTLLAVGADKIDGNQQRVFSKGRSLTVISDGVGEWHIIAKVP
jgi:hypothetical protein